MRVTGVQVDREEGTGWNTTGLLPLHHPISLGAPRDALGTQESNSGRLGLREQVRNLGSRNWGTRWGWGVRNEAKAQLSELGHFPCGTRVLYILPAEILETGVCLPLGPGRACQVRGHRCGWVRLWHSEVAPHYGTPSVFAYCLAPSSSHFIPAQQPQGSPTFARRASE